MSKKILKWFLQERILLLLRAFLKEFIHFGVNEDRFYYLA